MHATRYQNTTSGKELTWKSKPEMSLKGRTIVIVDDILDGGLTLAAVKSYCENAGAGSVYTAVLVDKVDARVEGGLKQPDFSALTVDNHYVFGYGMDYKGYLRNAPGIYRVAAEHE